ncbi:hypothetical protein V202x_24130 [Gimesia aquarii]|uniref:Uncharacterized protein n=1 Tax=Gimesia aquarii TaxID=2527964 RepID=A0A517WUY9_9PLAN|nr:hypothetical protein V202x_24130 [Gimesia aquarii]
MVPKPASEYLSNAFDTLSTKYNKVYKTTRSVWLECGRYLVEIISPDFESVGQWFESTRAYFFSDPHVITGLICPPPFQKSVDLRLDGGLPFSKLLISASRARGSEISPVKFCPPALLSTIKTPGNRRISETFTKTTSGCAVWRTPFRIIFNKNRAF